MEPPFTIIKLKKMKRSLHSHTITMREQRSPDSPRRKRPQKEALPLSDADDDDIAALLLSLAKKKSSIDTKETETMKRQVEHQEKAGWEQRHRVVSDDEDDQCHGQSAAKKKRKTSAESQVKLSNPSDWRSFSRPIGPPPRLPKVPAGFVFPARLPSRK